MMNVACNNLSVRALVNMHKLDHDLLLATAAHRSLSPDLRCRGALQLGRRIDEAVELGHENGGARLACIVLAPGYGPDLTAPHSSPHTETASKKA